MKMVINITIGGENPLMPWFQKFDTFGQFKTKQFGALGVFVKIDHGFKNK